MEKPNKPMSPWGFALLTVLFFGSPLAFGLLIIRSEILFRTLAFLALAFAAFILVNTTIGMIQLKLMDRRKERELRESRRKQENRR